MRGDKSIDEDVAFLNNMPNFIVIDFKELNQGRIDADVAEFFNPVVLIPIEDIMWHRWLNKVIHG